MKYSLFAPKGLHLYQGGKPLAQAIHETALALFAKYGADQGSLSTEPGSLIDLFSFMLALALARAARMNQRADGERFADGAYHLLAAFEQEYGLRPGDGDTLATRRSELAQAKRFPRGCTRAELEQQIRDLLGDDFIGVHIPAAADVVNWPEELGDEPQLLVDPLIPRKLVRLPYAVSTGLGAAQYIAYEPIDPAAGDDAEGTLTAGDQLVIGVENLGLAEVVEVLSVQEPGDGETYPLMEVVLTKAHDPGALGAAMPFPAWGSSQRHVFAVLTRDAGLDPEIRRKLDDKLTKILAGVTTWTICPASGAAQAGPWTLGDPVLSRLGMNPMGTLSVP